MFTLTLVGWAIFRCGSPAQLGEWFSAFTRWEAAGGSGYWKPAIGEAMRTVDPAITVDWLRPAFWFLIHAVPLALLEFTTRHVEEDSDLDHWPWLARSLAYGLMFLGIVSSTGGDVEFIYFQF
jgi:hypothetical protein